MDAPSTFLFFLFAEGAFLTVFLSAAFHISVDGSCDLLIENVKCGPAGARATNGVGTPERRNDTVYVRKCTSGSPFSSS